MLNSTITFATREKPVGTIHGDRSLELELLVSHDLPRFHRKAYQRLKNRQDAEDAVQDALVSACEHISEFEGRSSLSTWLTSIVINAARLQLRRKRPSRILFEHQFGETDGAMVLAEVVPDERPSPYDILTSAELRHQVAQSISSLSPLLRKTLCHYYFDGMTASELAAMLGVPLGTVKARISRARARLKCALRPPSAAGPSNTAFSQKCIDPP